MAKLLPLTLFSILLQFASAQNDGNISLYISKQSSEFSKYSGSIQKSTDKHESGSVTLNTNGPITVATDPQQLTINPNESKTWTGTISADASAGPQAGQSANAKLTANSTTQYSRPKGTPTSSGETVLSTYQCGKCSNHPNGGEHEIVKRVSSYEKEFIIYSLNVTLEGKDIVCKGSSIILSAKGYPDGGAYSWKSLNESVIGVTGNEANGTVTCKTAGGYGTGEVEVTYTIEGVTYKEKKKITFFDLSIKLLDKSICDGKSVSVTVTPLPIGTDKAKVKEALGDIIIKSEPSTVVKGNIKKSTAIEFTTLDDQWVSTGKEAFWYSTQTACNTGSQYDIWAEATCGEGSLTSKKVQLQVNITFGNCLAGDASVNVKLPVLNKPLYKNPKVDWKNLIITFDQPEGDYPEIIIKGFIDPKTKNHYMYAIYNTGKFKLSQTKININTGKESQFYPLVQFEEEFHTKQFEGETNILELKNMLSAQDVINKLNGILQAKPYLINPNQPFEQQFAAYTAAAWGQFITQIEIKVNEFNNLSSVWAQTIRCRLEKEAKDALKAQFGDIYIADMPCAYKNCK
jgi:hypothetical protein